MVQFLLLEDNLFAMGYSRKEEIARLKKDRKEAKAAKKRKENVRDRQVRFLIVCEGTKTEPLYFEALVTNYTSTVRNVTIEGEGRATVALVEKALEIKKALECQNAMTFDRVWVVFDKDDFEDFNEAIALARRYGFKSAWTNEAFELWYYLHFEYLDTGINRVAYIEKLEEALIKRTGDVNFKYKKGNRVNYQLMQTYGREDLAKRFAVQLRKLSHGNDYATHKPCTMVDYLVRELEKPEKLLK